MKKANNENLNSSDGKAKDETLPFATTPTAILRQFLPTSIFGHQQPKTEIAKPKHQTYKKKNKERTKVEVYPLITAVGLCRPRP